MSGSSLACPGRPPGQWGRLTTKRPSQVDLPAVLERRAAPRITGSLRVVFDSEGGTGSGMTQDLSSGGLLLTTRSALHAGAEVRGEIQLPDGRTAPFVAAVRWMRPVRAADLDSKRLLVGLKFVDPTPTALAAFVQRRSGAEVAAAPPDPPAPPPTPTPRVEPPAPASPTPAPRTADDEGAVVFEQDGSEGAGDGGQWRSLPALAACLIEAGSLDGDMLAVVLEHARRWSCSVGDAVRQLDLVPEGEIARVVSNRYGLRIVDLARVVVPRTVVRHLPGPVARKFGLAPLRMDATGRRGLLHVALHDAETIALLPDIEAMIGTSLQPWVAVRSAVRRLIDDLYG